MKKLSLLCALAFTSAFSLQPSAFAQTTNLPPEIAGQLPSGAPVFNPAGLSFTNVTWKAAAGVESVTTGGTLGYLQADVDTFKVGSAFDLGFGIEAVKSSTDQGLYSASGDLEAIRNLSNWQLVGKAGYRRVLEQNIGNYLNFGFDVNYNLTAGAGLGFLGSTKGDFTYVGAGVDWGTTNPGFNIQQAQIQKSFRIYAGIAF